MPCPSPLYPSFCSLTGIPSCRCTISAPLTFATPTPFLEAQRHKRLERLFKKMIPQQQVKIQAFLEQNFRTFLIRAISVTIPLIGRCISEHTYDRMLRERMFQRAKTAITRIYPRLPSLSACIMQRWHSSNHCVREFVDVK